MCARSVSGRLPMEQSPNENEWSEAVAEIH